MNLVYLVSKRRHVESAGKTGTAPRLLIMVQLHEVAKSKCRLRWSSDLGVLGDGEAARPAWGSGAGVGHVIHERVGDLSSAACHFRDTSANRASAVTWLRNGRSGEFGGPALAFPSQGARKLGAPRENARKGASAGLRQPARTRARSRLAGDPCLACHSHRPELRADAWQ